MVKKDLYDITEETSFDKFNEQIENLEFEKLVEDISEEKINEFKEWYFGDYCEDYEVDESDIEYYTEQFNGHFVDEYNMVSNQIDSMNRNLRFFSIKKETHRGYFTLYVKKYYFDPSHNSANHYLASMYEDMVDEEYYDMEWELVDNVNNLKRTDSEFKDIENAEYEDDNEQVISMATKSVNEKIESMIEEEYEEIKNFLDKIKDNGLFRVIKY